MFTNNKDCSGGRNIVPLNRVIGNQLVQTRKTNLQNNFYLQNDPFFFIFMVKQAFVVVNVFLSFLYTRDA